MIKTALRMAVLIGLGTILAGCTPAAEPPPVEHSADGDEILQTALEDIHLQSWETAEVVSARQIRITFSREAEPSCIRHAVDIRENRESITITLLSGDIPHAKKACSTPPLRLDDGHSINRETATALIDLSIPVDGRDILDGAEAAYREFSEGLADPQTNDH